MTKTKLFLLCTFLLTACAGGDDDRDTAANDTTGGSVNDTSSGSATMTTMTTDDTMATMTTAPTTASTLTTDATETTEADSGTEDSTTGDPGGLTCDSYCSTYFASCVDFSEYANEEDCVANCEQWPVGEDTDTAVDSLGCRIYHAGVAGMSDPDMHCPHAGPSGAATCVTANAPDCENYCMVFATNCVDGLYTYDDNDDCLAQCSTWYAGSAKDTSGHTIGCRTYHAGAAEAAPDKHCPHAGAGGGGICVL